MDIAGVAKPRSSASRTRPPEAVLIEIYGGKLSGRVKARRPTPKMRDCYRRIDLLVNTVGSGGNGRVRKISHDEWLAQ